MEEDNSFVESIIDIDSSLLGPCPWHFNCSIIESYDDNKKRDGYLLAYRCSEINPHLRTVKMGYDFKPIPSTDRRISFLNESEATFYEDPRLFKVGEELHVAYTTYSYHGFYCWVGYNKVTHDSHIKPNFPRYKANSWAGGVEKNWQFFDYAEKPHYVYTINPHIVCEANGSGEPPNIYETKIIPMWKWGVKRGGTPPQLIGDKYYSFFHSRFDVDKKAKYYVGFYCFDNKPPFPILGIVPFPVFEGDVVNAHNKAVVFPCGAILENGKWIVSYGYNDMNCKIAILDHNKLVGAMINPSRYRKVYCLRDRMVGAPCGWKFGNYVASNWIGLRSKVPKHIPDEDIESHICLKLLEMGADHFVDQKWVI